MSHFVWFLFIVIGLFTAEINCGDEEECDENSKFNSCGTACPEYCGEPAQTMCTMNCVPRCECNAGYKLAPGTEKCIKCP